MIRVGLAGIGFMGMIHYLSYQKIKGVKVVALCEVNQKRLGGDWTDIKGNFGPAGEMMDLSGIAKYTRLEEMLADQKVDMVDLCLPPAAHAEATIASLKAGKHVFCEKPISLDLKSAKRMVDAAAKHRKQLMIGHVLPFFPEYAFAYRAAQSGKYGRLLGGHFKRIISDPLWLKNYYDPSQVGGPALDLHIHDAHFIRLLCGMPKSVMTSGRMRGEVAEFFTSQFTFDDPALSITATSGVIAQQGRPFTAGFEIHFEKATLLYDFAVIDGKPELAIPLTVLTSKGGVERPDLGSTDPVDSFRNELAAVVKSAQLGKPSEILDGRLACDALAMAIAETESIVKGRLARL